MNRGYIALTSSIIISILLISIASSLSIVGFLDRFNIEGATVKLQSAELAKACVYTAFLKLREENTYGGDQNVAVGEDTCHIFPLQIVGANTIIETSGAYRNSYTNFRVTVDSLTHAFVSWEEIPAL